MKFCVFVASREQKLSNSFVQDSDFILTEGTNFRSHAAKMYRKYHEMWDIDVLNVRFDYANRTVASVTVVDGLCQKFKMNSLINLHIIEDKGVSRLVLDIAGTRYLSELSRIEETLRMCVERTNDLIEKVSEIEGKEAATEMNLFAKSEEKSLDLSEKRILIKYWHDLLDSSSDAANSTVSYDNQIDDIINSSESIKSLREKLVTVANGEDNDESFKQMLWSFLKSLM